MSEADIEGNAEKYVKRYLDRVGYILIQDMPDDGILTDYKEMRNRVAEVPASACAEVEDLLYGTTHAAEEMSSFLSEHPEMNPEGKAKRIYEALTKPKKLPKVIKEMQTRRERVDRMYKEHKGAHTIRCRVDAEGKFKVRDVMYSISDEVKAYQSIRTKDDVYYEMDTIIVLRDADGRMYFYDQEYRPIDEGAVCAVI